MRPPVCDICDKDFDFTRDNCGLVYFKKRQSDIEWDKRMKKNSMTGHPPYARWFCPEHYSEAVKLSSLAVDEAIKKLREFFKY
jgi:hypothetical protein